MTAIQSIINGDEGFEAVKRVGFVGGCSGSRCGGWDTEFALAMKAGTAIIEVGLIGYAAFVAHPHVHDRQSNGAAVGKESFVGRKGSRRKESGIVSLGMSFTNLQV